MHVTLSRYKQPHYCTDEQLSPDCCVSPDIAGRRDTVARGNALVPAPATEPILDGVIAKTPGQIRVVMRG
ncbi:hypothetical protein GCM10027597_27980 [Saccharopolyspora tripterygii]